MMERFSSNVLRIDAAAETARISRQIRQQVAIDLKRKGAVLGLSGGIDSSVAAALCVRALGADRVLGLLMPEMDSSADSLWLGQMLADHFGIETILEDITSTLEAAGCYRRRDEAIRMVIPDYTEKHRCKIIVSPTTDEGAFAVFSAVTESPTGERKKARLTPLAYRGVVAASNFKQRVRAMMTYYHADRLQYAYIGTPNRLEYDQGFFVKNGDGAADLKPLAHLYKSQVYQLADYLGIPEEIRKRPPTTDTYSMEQTQEEFYFSIPLEEMDLCLYGKNHGMTAEDIATAIGRTSAEVSSVLRSIDSKRATTRYLHAKPLLCDSDPLESWVQHSNSGA
jgi:NAD+ synthase